jgi:hypothetical protein
MSRQADLRETPSLLVAAFRQFTQLLQDEVALAKAELRRNVSRAGTGLALIGVAAILALTAFDVVAAASVAWLAAEGGLSVGTSAIVVGGSLLAVAVVLALVGRSRLSANALAPDRTTRSVKADIDSLREAANG